MADIPIWYQCNNNCLMCSNPSYYIDNSVGYKYNFESIKERIDNFEKGGVEFQSFNEAKDSFILTGGEPTINPDFFKIVNYINLRFHNSKISLLTNGRRFFYLEFVQKCSSLPWLYYQISLHGHDNKSHDLITQVPGSFEQTVSGIKNLLQNNVDPNKIAIRIVINKLNYNLLENILEFITTTFPSIKNVVLIFMEYEGQAIRNMDKIKIRYQDLNSL